jgi:hypothetical protein
METSVEDFALGVYVALCGMLLVAMLGFGPWVLEWIEGTPRETLVRRPRGSPRGYEPERDRPRYHPAWTPTFRRNALRRS